MDYNKIVVPVADLAWQRQQRNRQGIDSPRGLGHHDQTFATFLGIWALIHFSTFGYSAGLLTVVRLLGLLRYLLWPVIIVGVLVVLMRNKGHLLLVSIIPITPFFVSGVISALDSYDLFSAASPLWLWSFGVLAAAVFGIGCSGSRFRGAITIFFLAVIALSFIFILVRPDLGITADNREENGAWIGLFPGKNLFGLICVYGVVFSAASKELALPRKVFAILCCLLVLIFSHSQGAVVTASGVIATSILIQFLQRRNLSRSMQVSAFVFVLLIAILSLLVGFAAISQLLGRDTTLTGRTEIWADWFRLALEHWLTGTGPGSFTAPSVVTAAVSSSEAHLGAIHTPHNMMIAVFGETGLLGLSAFLIPLLYFAVLLPIRRPSLEANFTSLVTFTMLIGGITETREVFGVSLNMFLVVASYANCVREESLRRILPTTDTVPGQALALGALSQ